MKKLIIICIALVAFTLPSFSKNNFSSLPAQFDGTMLPYQFDEVEDFPQIPDSLTPVHIEYLARHGARFISSKKKIENLQNWINLQSQNNNLTTEGKEFKRLLDKVEAATSGKWGALNELGIKEQTRLGADMAITLARLFQPGRRVAAESTYVPRVVMSMYEFCHSLNNYSLNSLDIQTSEGPQNNDLLRFFTTDPEYVQYLKHGNWEAPLQEFQNEFLPFQPAGRLIKCKDTISKKQLQKYTFEMYGVIQALRSTLSEAPTTKWMTLKEYQRCWEMANLNHYLKRSVNSFSTVAATGSSGLIETFIHRMDAAASPGVSQSVANLYFAHAETLMPVVSTLGLPTAPNGYRSGINPPLSLENLSDYWCDWYVSPLGANLQIILFKSENSHYYALLRLNGRNTPAWQGAPLIVEWNELKNYWQHRLSSLENSVKAF